MALIREDKCKHFMNGAMFDRCLRLYTGYHNGQSITLEICVTSADIPKEYGTNPSDGDILFVSDAMAVDRYNLWVANMPNTEIPLSGSGHGGVVIP